MSRFFELATIIVVGVIVADFIGGFYVKDAQGNPTTKLLPFGGGSGVILSGVGNLWQTTVDALLGKFPDPPATASGPKPPGSQRKPVIVA